MLRNFDASGRQLTRFDTDGNAVDAHDGKLALFDGVYYLYGTSYGCGYNWGVAGAPFCGFKVYSSTDLVHWADRGALFDASTPVWQNRCNGSTYGCFRPHVIYNASSHAYVLWVNVYDNRVGFRVFTSATPIGPFSEAPEPTLAVNGNAAVGGLNNGDHDTFVDDDGTAYLALTDWKGGGALAIEQLDAGYLSGTGNVVTGITPGNTEAPALFRRGSRYYLTYSDPNCGYCGKGIAGTGTGAGTSYRSAPSPLGPWSAGRALNADSCGGQPAFVFALPLATSVAYLYGSDLWNNAAKNEGIANYYWSPLEFAADGSLQPLVCQASVELSLATGKAGAQTSVPNLDNSAGVDGFSSFCDISGQIYRAQSFVATRTGTLTRVSFTTFQAGSPNAGFTLAIHTANADFQPQGGALFSTTIASSGVGFAPRAQGANPKLPVTAGTRYAIVVHSTTSAGCYGMEYDDSSATGGAAYSNDGGLSFIAESRRSLQFQTAINTP